MSHHQPQPKAKDAAPVQLILPVHKNTPKGSLWDRLPEISLREVKYCLAI